MIDAAEVQHLAQLARLDLTAQEQQEMLSDLNKMLGYFEQLSALNTDSVTEMQRPVDLVNVMRDDLPGQMFSQQEALTLAPEQQDGFIRVPRTVEQ
ncbi:Asp-tRNA(Asn)/Glu-tRNA(Gln) amidotransferase subunit GatC [Deinococcus sonorensis]|uniref:Aspartyl/glutamyl-tRNA(Asn/Gln) amidotransferase subunit C n=2 Tax=Deinococcus sonorensis TaxID=309891 RepID=A0AAU7UBT5_9DEIO